MTVGQRGVGRNKKRKTGEAYFSPPEVTHALMRCVRFKGDVSECCAGDGSMAEIIKSYGHRVIATDLIDHGYGRAGVDCLSLTRRVDNTITNPPFSLAEELVPHALGITRRKVALFLRLAFLESAHRYEFFQKYPLAEVWVFTKRVTLLKPIRRANGKKKATKAVAYAWFVWDHAHKGPPILRFIPPELIS